MPDSRQAEEYYIALGKFTLASSYAEFGLNFCITMIYAFYMGAAIDKHPPRSLSRKIKLFRRAHSRELAHNADYALPLADRMTALRLKRQFLVHGFSSPIPDATGQLRFTSFEFRGFKELMTPMYTDLPEINRLGVEGFKLWQELTEYGRQLALSSSPDLADKSVRKFFDQLV